MNPTEKIIKENLFARIMAIPAKRKEYIITLVPKAKARHRDIVCRGKHVGKWNPSEKDEYGLAQQILLQEPERHASGEGLFFVIEFIMPRPKGHYGTGKNSGKLKDWAMIKSHTSKPDLDNLEKLLKDALNGIIYNDDSQVCGVLKIKRYTERDDAPFPCTRLIVLSF